MTVDAIFIQYRVRPECLDGHLALLRSVQEEVARRRPAGLRLLTLRLADGRTFVDVAMGPDLPEPLPSLESFRRFRADLEERCEERSMSEVTVLGSYGFGE
ncbi:hypothetical protein [Plantactinospora sp. GCM10030261]|uniref:hypothetical protein n=1 Tax=Plantactinospora sp. GCM10030261 TaxID=3273420 RepID=UPI00361F1090